MVKITKRVRKLYRSADSVSNQKLWFCVMADLSVGLFFVGLDGCFETIAYCRTNKDLKRELKKIIEGAK